MNNYADTIFLPIVGGLFTTVGYMLVMCLYLSIFAFIIGFIITCIQIIILCVVRKEIASFKPYLLTMGKSLVNTFCQSLAIFVVIYFFSIVAAKYEMILDINVWDVKGNYQTMVGAAKNLSEILPYLIVIGFVLAFWYFIFSSVFSGFTDEIARKTAQKMDKKSMASGCVANLENRNSEH